MEGMARAANRNVDLAIVGAWHTAIFALTGYAGKLNGKKLSDFLSGAEPVNEQKSQNAKAIAFFLGAKARGFDVEVTRH